MALEPVNVFTMFPTEKEQFVSNKVNEKYAGLELSFVADKDTNALLPIKNDRLVIWDYCYNLKNKIPLAISSSFFPFNQKSRQMLHSF